MLISPLIFLSLCDSTHEHYIISPTFPTKKISLLTKTTLPPPPQLFSTAQPPKKQPNVKYLNSPYQYIINTPQKNQPFPINPPPATEKNSKTWH